MITIIHGDDIVLSRKYLQEQKQNSISPYVFDGIIDLPTIAQIIQGSGLFSTEKNVFVENFFSKNKLTHSASSGLMLSKAEAFNSYDAKNLIKYINENDSLLNIFFWEASILQKRSTAIFNNPAIKLFKIPQTIFLFLDNIRPGDFRNMINLFHNALKNTLEELIFFMLQRQFRLLIAISDEKAKDQIDEVSRLAPWQKSKLTRQAKYFSTAKLLGIYKKLFEIEQAVKTGNLPYSLGSAIDFLLLSI